MKHIHLIGIGGSGLSAIALVLLESGYIVSGSDRQDSVLARRLQQAGAQVFFAHRPENIVGADVVVRSSAVNDENVEVRAAQEAGIPVLKRSDFLGVLMSGYTGIAVAGTHGKTTTTAMIAWMLTDLKQDPSYIIGGISHNLGANAHAGKGSLFVIEADEYDGMFLGLRPQIAVVTNIEHDHPDCYPTAQDFYHAFEAFVSRLHPGGVLVVCADDPGAASLGVGAQDGDCRVVTYGCNAHATGEAQDYAAANLILNDAGGYSFTFLRHGNPVVEQVKLQVPGRHNACNALAALVVADQLGLPFDQAALALGQYQGTARRFQLRGEIGGITVIDDYAHHPTEIRATLEAARSRFPGRPLWAVWQPHTFSRTRALAGEFIRAFGDAQHILVTEIYPAREAKPPDGFSARQLVEKMSAAQAGHQDFYFATSLAEGRDILLQRLQPGDVVLVFSAGDADWISAELLSGKAVNHVVADSRK